MWKIPKMWRWRINKIWTDFWYNYHPDPNPKYGGRSRSYYTFRESRLALVIAIITMVIIIFTL